MVYFSIALVFIDILLYIETYKILVFISLCLYLYILYKFIML